MMSDGFRSNGAVAGNRARVLGSHADRERTLGADHPETLTARGNLAHAYRAADAQVEIEANLVDGEVDITIHDRGKWREPRGEHRGRGLALMRGLMDDVQVARTDQGTTVRMRRRLRREART